MCDFLPPEQHAQSLAATLPVEIHDHVLWVRGTRSKDALREYLPSRCSSLTEISVYESTDVATLSPNVRHFIEQNTEAWITLTSSAIVRSAATLLGEYLPKLRAAALSPQIATEAKELGANVVATASLPNFESLVEAIASAVH